MKRTPPFTKTLNQPLPVQAGPWKPCCSPTQGAHEHECRNDCVWNIASVSAYQDPSYNGKKRSFNLALREQVLQLYHLNKFFSVWKSCWRVCASVYAAPGTGRAESDKKPLHL